MEELLKQLWPILLSAAPALIAVLLFRAEANSKIRLLQTETDAKRETQDGQVTLTILNLFGKLQTSFDGLTAQLARSNENVEKDRKLEEERQKQHLQDVAATEVHRQTATKQQADLVVELSRNSSAITSLASNFQEALNKTGAQNRDHVTDQIAFGVSDVKQSITEGIQPVSDDEKEILKNLNELKQMVSELALAQKDSDRTRDAVLADFGKKIDQLEIDFRQLIINQPIPIPDSVKPPEPPTPEVFKPILSAGKTPPYGTEIPKDVK